MVLLYHGTRLRAAKEIAFTGAILSPLEVEKQRLEKHFDDNGPPEEPISLDELAEKILKGSYQSGEFDLRARHISCATDWRHARDYALRFPQEGGVVLGMDIDITEARAVVIGENVFIPDRISLDYLREVRFPEHEQRGIGVTLRKVYAPFEQAIISTYKRNVHPVPEVAKSI